MRPLRSTTLRRLELGRELVDQESYEALADFLVQPETLLSKLVFSASGSSGEGEKALFEAIGMSRLERFNTDGERLTLHCLSTAGIVTAVCCCCL